MKRYDPSKIEPKWQKEWDKAKMHETGDSVKGRDNFMLLFEFPYPSGDLHIGHWFSYVVPDILARYKRMKGYNLMYPIGFDAFGLPAENAAIQRNINPSEWTKKNISDMSSQLKSMGASFDWSRKVETTDPEYYKWTQWIFLKFYENGLAYRDNTKVNWCPKDKTVLANEQVVDGKCDRCGAEVIQKELTQWMFKITKYADSLCDDIEDLDWPETTKLAQKNWIGCSEGALLKFKVDGSEDNIEVFTTRPDTIFGATFMVLAPEHEIVKRITADRQLGQVNDYLEKTKKKTELERLTEVKEKTGVFTGAYAVNPANGEKIPIWISDFVLPHYGTGAIMAVPAHDKRDYEFAKKFNLSIVEVVSENGILTNSGKFDGMESEKAKWEITRYLGGKKEIKYRLHDWILSRQRYWGVPIPMINCHKCGYVPVPEKDLPVKLPPLEDFRPTDDGRSPLAKAVKWLKVECPDCGSEAERETDTMDTFVDSSWYFIRYTDPENKDAFADKRKMEKWLPVPMYIGGAEHNTMHLLYSRFFTKALHGLGFINFSEPFLARRNHGVILGADSQKMSKSRGNVVNPDDYVEKYGSDTVRMFLAFMGPYENGGPWDPKAIIGVYRFLNRVWKLYQKLTTDNQQQTIKESEEFKKKLNQAIKKIGSDIEKLHFNTCISELMKLFNEIEKENEFSVVNRKLFVRLLAPFAPHLAEELWDQLGNKKSIHLEKWPEYNPKLVKEETMNLVIQINGRARDIIKVPQDLGESEVRELALASEKVKKHIAGKEIKKFIYVPGKIINLVI